jgi:hypothetical protein
MKDILFKNVSIEDRESIEFYLSKYSSFCLSIFTFASLVTWERVYHYQWAVSNNTLILKFIDPEDNNEHLIQPIGEFPLNLQNKIIEYARSLGYKLKIYGVSDLFIEKYTEFVSRFERTEHRDMDNYIYLAEDLVLLNGGKYQPKRNLLKQFETNNNWTSEPISAENIRDCFKVIGGVYDKKEPDENLFLSQELESLDFVLNNFLKFKEEGVLIRIDGKPVAFSIYEHLNPSMCVVHYEKAMREYKGLYQLINRETAKAIFSKGYKYINREEDLGIEGLRKAKLSYCPVKMCLAHVLVFKNKNAK